MAKLPKYGAGYYRMKRRLGTQRMEEIRQQVVADQARVLSEVSTARKVAERDRTTYTDYPAPKRR